MANVVSSGFVAETGFFLSLIIVNFSYVARTNPQSQVRVFLFWLKNRQKQGQNVGEAETVEKDTVVECGTPRMARRQISMNWHRFTYIVFFLYFSQDKGITLRPAHQPGTFALEGKHHHKSRNGLLVRDQRRTTSEPGVGNKWLL